MNAKLIVSILVLVAGLLIATSAQAQVAISEDGVTFPDNPEPVMALKQYKIGDRGPAGGWVFYVTDDGLHGLEAAPVDNSVEVPWGCYGTDIPGAEWIAVGKGKTNTDDIIRSCNETTPYPAAAAAFIFNSQSYSGTKGYVDWFLPSKDELNLMYGNLHNQVPPLGGFEDYSYWSSSEYGVNYAWRQDFNNDGYQNGLGKSLTSRVRAARAF